MDKIGMILFAIIGGGLGIVSSVYLVVSMFYTLGFKIYRKVKYGYTMYQ